MCHVGDDMIWICWEDSRTSRLDDPIFIFEMSDSSSIQLFKTTVQEKTKELILYITPHYRNILLQYIIIQFNAIDIIHVTKHDKLRIDAYVKYRLRYI